MWFPAFEMQRSGHTFALIITESGQFDIRTVKAVNGLLFYVDHLGIFQLNKENRLIFGKCQVYLFDQKAINSLNVGALIDINKYLKENKEAALEQSDIALLVDSIRMRYTGADLIRVLQELGVDPKDPQLGAYLSDKTVENATAQYQHLAKGLQDNTIRFLNRYYEVDKMAISNIWLSIFETSAFKMKKSGKVMPYNIFQPSAFAQNIALVVIDNRLLDVDAKIKVRTEIEEDETVTYIESKKYGQFKIADPKTIYRFRKTRIYVVAVQTKPREKKATAPKQELEAFMHP